MNFTFTIEWVKVFGGIKNGTWTGMIGISNKVGNYGFYF